MEKSYKDVKSDGNAVKLSPWAAALRAAAKVEVTKLIQKWLPLLPGWHEEALQDEGAGAPRGAQADRERGGR